MSVPDQIYANSVKDGFIVHLGEDKSAGIDMAGGKGASLGKLVKAGFPVPLGFVITTGAYTEFIRVNNLEAKIDKALNKLNYSKLDKLNETTAGIREDIYSGTIPALISKEIKDAYKELGEKPYVAVRSSGTAEDLAGSSFAGQYETFLDIRGEKALLETIKKCWASMWTARVSAYRHSKGFDKGTPLSIAVVVQKMVEAEVAGVMFVGNPMNARADEIVINASWGLGEAVVSGSVIPDEYIIRRDSLKIIRRSLGTKEMQVIRDKKTGKGTIREPVLDSLQNQYTLSDEQAVILAKIGQRVNEYYSGIPQDTEWALSNSSFYLLQSRPITGVEFTWEEDLETWPSIPQEEGVIWTRAAADEWWTGAITPLMWSIRSPWIHAGAAMSYEPLCIADLATMRWMKYSRGTMYYNTRVDILMAEYSLPPSLREPMLRKLHPSQIEEALKRPFDLWRAIKMFANIELNYPTWSGNNLFNNGTAWNRKIRKSGELYERKLARIKEMHPSKEELRSKTDEELRQMIDDIHPGCTMREAERNAYLAQRPKSEGHGGWGAHFFYGQVIPAVLEGVIKYWYTGNNPNAYTEVISGLPERTQQFYDDLDFWKLGETIRKSKKLRALINKFEGRAFFEELRNSEEGQALLKQYEEFLETNYYRGMADRDIYYTRRVDDPNIDYKALRIVVNADNLESLEEREEKLIKRRETATADVINNLSKQPMGDLKVPVFNFLQGYCLKMLTSRDDTRPSGEITVYRKKLILDELGRRTVERDLLKENDDFYFLASYELVDLLRGKEPVPLARAKAAARKKAFFKFLNHEEDPPMFLRDNTPLDSDETLNEVSGDSVFKGFGTSPGIVTGRARIVPMLENIGNLEKGDILVCHGTDPGWASAFSIVSAVVAQTGGILAHFSCLSREYGIPAVSLQNAMKLIKEGEMIKVNGTTGEVRHAI